MTRDSKENRTERINSMRLPERTYPEKIVFIGLLLLIIIIPFDDGGNGYILQFITRLIVLLCAFAWSMQAIRRGSIALMFSRIDWCVVGFAIWSLISIITTPYTYATLLEVIKILTYVAVFYLCRTLFPLNTSQTMLLLAAILGSSLLQFLRAFLPGLTRHSPHLQASFSNPNHLACLLGLGITIAFSALLFQSSLFSPCKLAEPPGRHLTISTTLSICSKIAAALIIGSLFLAIIFIKSRGALVGVVGSGLLLTALKRKRWSIIFLMLVVCVLILPMPWGSSLQRLLKLHDPYAYQRLGIWNSSMRMMADHPVFGVGPGMYRYFGEMYNFPLEQQVARYAKMPNLAHNDALQVGAEFGLPGLLLMLGGIGIFAADAFQFLRHPPFSPQSAAAVAGLLGLLLQGIFSNLFASPAIAVVATVLGAIAIDGVLQTRPPGHSPHCPLRRTLRRRWPWYSVQFLLCASIFWFTLYVPTAAHIQYLQFYEAFSAHDYAAAVNHLTMAIRYVPIHAYYHHDRGTLCATAFQNRPEERLFQEGVDEFSQAIRLNPKNYEHWQALAELYVAQFQQSPHTATARTALRAYRQALQRAPFDPFIRYSMALLHVQIQEFDDALALLRQAVADEPNFVGGYQLLSAIFTTLQRDDEAQQAYRQAEMILQQHAADAQNSEYARALLRSQH